VHDHVDHSCGRDHNPAKRNARLPGRQQLTGFSTKKHPYDAACTDDHVTLSRSRNHRHHAEHRRRIHRVVRSRSWQPDDPEPIREGVPSLAQHPATPSLTRRPAGVPAQALPGQSRGELHPGDEVPDDAIAPNVARKPGDRKCEGGGSKGPALPESMRKTNDDFTAQGFSAGYHPWWICRVVVGANCD